MEKKKKTLPTDFAPSERLSKKEINNQYDQIRKINNVVNILNAFTVVGMILNKERQIIFANQTLMEMLGLSDIGSIIGCRPGELFQCNHASEHNGGCGASKYCRLCGAVGAVLESQEINGKVTKDCHISTSVDGTTSALDLRVTADTLDIDGEIITFVSILDIADEKRRQLLERIFFHDLLNTAGGIKGMLDFLTAKDMVSSDTLADILPKIAISSQQMLEDIYTQRDLILAEHGDLQVRFTAVDSLVFLSEFPERYNSQHRFLHRHLVFDTKSDSFSFISDETLLRRVLDNLIKNALEASTKEETILFGVRKVKDTVIFTVHNPEMMSEDVQLQLFQRSFSTKGKNRGIGTYSIKLLTEQYLKGSVSFTSSNGNGTVFSLHLPIELQ